MISSFASRLEKCLVTLRPHEAPTDFASTMPQMPSTFSDECGTRGVKRKFCASGGADEAVDPFISHLRVLRAEGNNILCALSDDVFKKFISACESCFPAMRRDLLALLIMRLQGYLTDDELLLASDKVCAGA